MSRLRLLQIEAQKATRLRHSLRAGARLLASLSVAALWASAVPAAQLIELTPGIQGSRIEALADGQVTALNGQPLTTPRPAMFLCAGSSAPGSLLQARVLSETAPGSGVLGTHLLVEQALGPPQAVRFNTCHRWIQGPGDLMYLLASRAEQAGDPSVLEVWVTAGDSTSFKRIHRFDTAAFGGVERLGEFSLLVGSALPVKLSINNAAFPPAASARSIGSIDDPTLTGAVVGLRDGADVLFTAIRGSLSDRVLWRIRPSDELAEELLDMSPGSPAGANNAIGPLHRCGVAFYFSGVPDQGSPGLFRLSPLGQPAVEVLRGDGSRLGFPEQMRTVAGNLHLGARTGASGFEPYRIDCSTHVATQLGELAPGAADADPGPFLPVGPDPNLANEVAFTAFDAGGDRRLFATTRPQCLSGDGGLAYPVLPHLAGPTLNDVELGSVLDDGSLVVIASVDGISRGLFRTSNSLCIAAIDSVAGLPPDASVSAGGLPRERSFAGQLLVLAETPGRGRELYALPQFDLAALLLRDGFELPLP